MTDEPFPLILCVTTCWERSIHAMFTYITSVRYDNYSAHISDGVWILLFIQYLRMC